MVKRLRRLGAPSSNLYNIHGKNRIVLTTSGWLKFASYRAVINISIARCLAHVLPAACCEEHPIFPCFMTRRTKQNHWEMRLKVRPCFLFCCNGSFSLLSH